MPKRKALTVADKIRILNDVETGMPKKLVAQKYKIPSCTLSTVIKNRDAILKCQEAGGDERRKLKQCKFNSVDEAVLKWVTMVRNQNLPLSGPLIKEKAIAYAEMLGIDDFQASSGWLDKFKKRHGITKFNVIKKLDADERRLLGRTFEPITTAIGNLVPQDKSGKVNDESADDSSDISFHRHVVKSEDKDRYVSLDEIANVDSPSSQNDQPVHDISSSMGLLIPEYLEKLNSQVSDLDRIYGVKLMHNGELKIGNSKITFHRNYLKLKNQTFPVTKGLLELIFLKHPVGYTERDLLTYKEVLLLSHRQKSMDSRSHKYERIIKPLIHTKKGSGNYSSVGEHKLQYYDSADDLVTRLRKLVSSQLSGNNNLQPEVQAIIHELRELDIIF